MTTDNVWHTIFVYGTLRSGGSNAFRMDGARFLGRGNAAGCLYRVDWYPGAVFDRNAITAIVGELYLVPAGQLKELDAFEGEEYERVNILVTTEEGEEIASAWEYRKSTTSLQQLMSGDWLEEYGP